MTRYVIIGGGPAGAIAALKLRKLDHSGEIVIISDEDYQFYKRSKIINLISKSCTEDELFIKGKNIYYQNNIGFINDYVKKIDPEKNQVILNNGTHFHYDYLLIASGGSPIMLPWKGVNLEGIHTLYNLKDAKEVAKQVCNAKQVVIIGGGSIAMKAIQNFKKIGLEISIIEKASHLWPIGFDRKVARIVEQKIKENGIHIYLNEEIVEFKGENNKISSVVLKGGRKLAADLVVITIGMRPNINFLKDSGIQVDKGVIVDEYMRANFSNIFAAGDVAQLYDPLYETPILHPTWGNAKKQGKIAAKNMVGSAVKYKGAIPVQSIKIFGFTAIAVGITHSKKNFDELSYVSFEKKMSRKFVLKNNHLMGILVIGKNINKKVLKPILKKKVFDQAILPDVRNVLWEEDINLDELMSKV